MINSISVLNEIVQALKDWSANLFLEPKPVFDRVVPKVLLKGCKTVEEHYEKIKQTVQLSTEKEGLDGLQACGFHYQFTPCMDHRNASNHVSTSLCINCGNRLFHTESKTLITKHNRNYYIADGEMYDACSSLCQEYAHELMQSVGGLHWVSVCEDEKKGNPIRILVDRDFSFGESSQDSPTKPILLVMTGKGKVRAGIFSRQHLLVSSIESSTALPMIQDAQVRDMCVAILDPNARGENNGMATFTQSMTTLFGKIGLDCNTKAHNHGHLYILSHSASGAQLARYLQTDGQHLLKYIKSIAFTDSTHSIQWLKDHHEIASFFTGPASLYIRSSNEYIDNHWENHRPGDTAATDKNWQHRFGKIRTVWAGTSDHSLTNWYSHSCIWDHFDRCSDLESAKPNHP